MDGKYPYFNFSFFSVTEKRKSDYLYAILPKKKRVDLKGQRNPGGT